MNTKKAKTFEIDFVTDDPAAAYAKEIRAAKSKEALVKVLEYYHLVTDEGLEDAKKFTDRDFKDFKRDIRLAKKEATEEWSKYFSDRFGNIAMPLKMMVCTITAMQFHAPWGCAFMRSEEEGWPQIPKKKSKGQK